MTSTHPLPAQALDQALPSEVTGSGHSLLTRYRVYPVFSPAWARGRTRVWSALAVLLLLLVALVPLPARNTAAEFPLGALLQLAVQLLLPILLGPWLCARVRLQAWPPAREWWALVGVIVALIAGVQAFHAWAAEPVKQWAAERVGAVDETGKRKRVQVAIGVMLSDPDEAASAPARDPAGGQPPGARPLPPAAEPGTQAMNAVSSAALTFILGGGMGLATWRRQRAALATLARERELQRAQAQRREAELQLSVLAAQVEPHFLFNTLAGVRSAISTDPARASTMIDRLVDYLRAAIPRLRSDGAAAATLGSQLEIVRAYLGLMQARMPRLGFEIDAPESLLDAPFPPWMLISLAENAVKHGAEPKVGPVRVRVSASRGDDGRLSVTVADDGAGFDAQAHAGGGLGLSNIRERLRQMHGERAALTLRAQPGGGVAATLTLPLD